MQQQFEFHTTKWAHLHGYSVRAYKLLTNKDKDFMLEPIGDKERCHKPIFS